MLEIQCQTKTNQCKKRNTKNSILAGIFDITVKHLNFGQIPSSIIMTKNLARNLAENLSRITPIKRKEIH